MHKDRITGVYRLLAQSNLKYYANFSHQAWLIKNPLLAQIPQQLVLLGTMPLASGHSLCSRNLKLGVAMVTNFPQMQLL